MKKIKDSLLFKITRRIVWFILTKILLIFTTTFWVIILFIVVFISIIFFIFFASNNDNKFFKENNNYINFFKMDLNKSNMELLQEKKNNYKYDFQHEFDIYDSEKEEWENDDLSLFYLIFNEYKGYSPNKYFIYKFLLDLFTIEDNSLISKYWFTIDELKKIKQDFSLKTNPWMNINKMLINKTWFVKLEKQKDWKLKWSLISTNDFYWNEFNFNSSLYNKWDIKYYKYKVDLSSSISTDFNDIFVKNYIWTNLISWFSNIIDIFEKNKNVEIVDFYWYTIERDDIDDLKEKYTQLKEDLKKNQDLINWEYLKNNKISVNLYKFSENDIKNKIISYNNVDLLENSSSDFFEINSTYLNETIVLNNYIDYLSEIDKRWLNLLFISKYIAIFDNDWNHKWKKTQNYWQVSPWSATYWYYPWNFHNWVDFQLSNVYKNSSWKVIFNTDIQLKSIINWEIVYIDKSCETFWNSITRKYEWETWWYGCNLLLKSWDWKYLFHYTHMKAWSIPNDIIVWKSVVPWEVLWNQWKTWLSTWVHLHFWVFKATLPDNYYDIWKNYTATKPYSLNALNIPEINIIFP